MTASALRRILDRTHLDGEAVTLCVDLADVVELDVEAMAALIGNTRRANAVGVRLRLINLSAEVRNAIKAVGLADFLYDEQA